MNLFFAAPDGVGPCWVIGVAGYYVNVELADDVADGSDVDFLGWVLGGEVLVEEFGELSDGEADGGVVASAEVVQLGDGAVYFWDEDEPWVVGVVFEKDAADAEGAEVEASFGEAFIEGEGHA